ncbi:MAG: Rpn family recombination-promoting nuclease/putative transposase, partial [Cyanobacteria bacterium]|nr:Rpn family recombination-promoting nuclease/putative transposase [Cyanobacteriota bacterium]
MPHYGFSRDNQGNITITRENSPSSDVRSTHDLTQNPLGYIVLRTESGKCKRWRPWGEGSSGLHNFLEAIDAYNESKAVPYLDTMVYPLQDKYISLLTDFGFKRVFGTEPNKAFLIDFLNTLLPDQHRIQDLSFKNNENLGSTQIDRKAIFDIYCQAESGERFIVEIQKAKQNFFKDRSVYYATFPIQEQAQKGDWNFQLGFVYTVGVLDFIFDDHKHDETIV